jgi:hypothetical protein
MHGVSKWAGHPAEIDGDICKIRTHDMDSYMALLGSWSFGRTLQLSAQPTTCDLVGKDAHLANAGGAGAVVPEIGVARFARITTSPDPFNTALCYNCSFSFRSLSLALFMRGSNDNAICGESFAR